MPYSVTNIFLVVAGLAGLLSVGDAATCSAQSASDCLSQAQLSTLQSSSSNPTQYCEQATLRLVQVGVCLANCNFARTSDITTAQSNLNSYCATAVPGANCTDLVGSYNNYIACVSSLGGASAIVSDLFMTYNARSTLPYSKCQKIYGVRTCQKPFIENCSPYMDDLDVIYQSASPVIALGLAACGSEAVPHIQQTDGCTAGLSASIEAQCNYAAPLYNAQDSQTICSLLQNQADCIMSLASTCTSAQIQYLLPRYSSYAMANTYLGCSVQVFGLLVLPRSESQCNSSAQLNSCFFLSSVISAINIYYLRPLLNRDMPISGFCTSQTQQGISAQLQACYVASLTCINPHEKIYDKPTTYTDSFAPSIGVFPLNAWGVQSIYNWLSTRQCPAQNPWIDALYSVSATSTTITTTTPTPAATSTSTGATRQTRITPPKQEVITPPPQSTTIRNANGVGNIRLPATPPPMK